MNYKYALLQVVLLASVTATAQTQRIEFKAPLLYPEGTAYYPAGGFFFVSSVTTGTIGRVYNNRQYSVFYEDKGLKSSYGMKVDMKRNKLWVCTGDANNSFYSEPSTFKKLARVISLNLQTGKKEDDIDLSNLLPGQHFANDLILDSTGNIYVTDSYAAAIYKIDRQLKPTVLVQHPLFKSIDVGLNGIVWHPKGFLIAAHSTNGELYKINLSNPSAVEVIEVNSFFPGADGLILEHGNSLALVQNRATKIYRLKTSNNWNTATVVGATLLEDRFDYPTTITIRGNQFYVVNAKLNELSDPTEVPSKEFALQLVRFVLVN